MNLIKADHQRKLKLAGVLNPVSRPVDIDQAQTGLACLRSLRIYCFDAGSVIDGHAEDDEVMIVILAGSVQLTLSPGELEEDSPRCSLEEVHNAAGDPCVAYLPPNGAYQLVPSSNAEVAYARAKTSETRAPRVFSFERQATHGSASLVFEDTSYPVHLRVRVAQVEADQESVTWRPVDAFESTCEALVHVRTEPERGVMTCSTAEGSSIALESWDTVSVQAGEHPEIHVASASSSLLLVILALGSNQELS